MRAAPRISQTGTGAAGGDCGNGNGSSSLFFLSTIDQHSIAQHAHHVHRTHRGSYCPVSERRARTCPGGSRLTASLNPEQHIGRISHITPTPTYELTVSDAGKILNDCSIGDSIAVNGACLTVTEFDAQAGWFKIGLGAAAALARSLSKGEPGCLEGAN